MAEKYELKVLIDLHGAKGSQNGKDHSGQIGKNEWHKHKEYRQQTVDTLEKVARRYYAAKSVWGIELINEPKSGIVQWKLRWFYKRAYDRLRRVARPGTVIVFHDAFMPRLLSGALGSDPNFPIVMDVHWYQFGSKWRQREKLADYFTRIQRRAGLLVKLQRKQPVIIGEWSMVLTQGVLAGRSRQDAEVAYRQHGVLQMKTYDFALGWFYWSYKTEERNVWNFRALIEDGRSSLK